MVKTGDSGDLEADYFQPTRSICSLGNSERNAPRAEANRATIARCRTDGWNVANDDGAEACAVWDFACETFAPRHQPAPLGDLFK